MRATRLSLPVSIAMALVAIAGLTIPISIGLLGSPTLAGAHQAIRFDPNLASTPATPGVAPAIGVGGGDPGNSAASQPGAPVAGTTGLSEIFDRGSSRRNEIALTIDAGPVRGQVDEILDLLAERGIHASFAVTGRWALENADLMKRIVSEGHMVLNDGWDHQSFTGLSTGALPLSKEQRASEVAQTEAAIRQLTGYATAPYFRPPFGDIDDTVRADLAAAGYSATVTWSCDTQGWRGASTDEIVARCGDNARAGDIVSLSADAMSNDAEALPALIDALVSRGFTLVTVAQIVQP